MRVFVTGATGFIGSAIVRELLAAGHQVLGLARSDAAAAKIASADADVHRGALDDLDSLRSGAAASDGVIHAAFNNLSETTDFAAACQADRRAIETLGAALAGSDRPFVVTSGTALLSPGRLVTEEDAAPTDSAASPRFASEGVALSLASRGEGVSAYPGDGSNRWAAVHRLDAAHLFRLALETAPAGSRLHAVADEGVPVRDIAGVIGRRLNVPVVALSVEEAGEHFGFLGQIFSTDCPASSTLTQQRLGWHPVQPALLADLDQDYYFKNER